MVRNPLGQQGEQGCLMYTVKCRPDIPFNHPEVLAAFVDVAVKQRDAVHRSASGPKSIGPVEEIALPNRFQQNFEQHLDDAIFQGRDTQLSLLAVPLRNIDPSHCAWVEATVAPLMLYL